MKLERRHLLIFLLVVCLGTWFFLSWLARSYESGENYSLIEDGLYMGGVVTQPPPGTKAVINLCRAKDGYKSGMAYYLAEPISDSEPSPSIEWLKQMVEVIDARRTAGLTLFVHCRNGVSRSGLLVTAYVMFRRHWTRNQAFAFVRARRPQTRPNPAFMERLLEWERIVKGQNDKGQPSGK